MSLGEIAAMTVLALAAMAINLAGGYWFGKDIFNHDSETPFRTRLTANALATFAIVVLLVISQVGR